jgi:hypothetical protein
MNFKKYLLKFTGESAMHNVANPDILFITVDSCRYDTFEAADAPNLKAIGPLYRAYSPSHYTYGAHASFFMGFTPGVAEKSESYINPKFAKIFKLDNAGLPGFAPAYMSLKGKSIMEGLRKKGYFTIGSGAAGWFNDKTETGKVLTSDFDVYYYSGNTYSICRQLDWINTQMNKTSAPKFVFLNVGETHVPYYYESAPWDRMDNPCRPFAKDNDAQKCLTRQKACLEYIDHKLAPLLARFAKATILACSDHGDCWGEDGLWEHGIHHPKTLEVPLLFRLA